MTKYQLILASQSPRRKELLAYLQVPFYIQAADLDEVTEETDPFKMVTDLAKQKGQAVFNQLRQEGKYPEPFIVASDTLVELNGEVLGKPKDKAHASEMLKKLSGKTHRVLTGVYLATNEKEHYFVEATEVECDELSEQLLQEYVNSNEPLDKAGAYGIQGLAQVFIKGIQGCYANVVGFPVNRFLRELKIFLGHPQQDWKAFF